MGQLHQRRIDRDHHLKRYSVDDPDGQTGAAAAPVSTGVRVFRAGAFLPENAGPTAGCGKHDHPGPLSRSSRKRRAGHGASKICRPEGAAAGLESEAFGA